MIAIVPMRHHSERVPRKNYRELAGRPTYSYILETLLEVPQLDAIWVDTDSAVIKNGVRQRYPSVKLIDRPEHLRSPLIPMNDVIAHDLGLAGDSEYLQTHSTNPLLRASTISAAILAFRNRGPDHESLFSVTRMQVRLWDSAGEPINHDPTVLAPTQSLDPIYVENSCLYIFEREQFLRTGNRIGSHPLMFEIDPLEAWDIDTEEDFRTAGLLITAMRR